MTAVRLVAVLHIFDPHSAAIVVILTVHRVEQPVVAVADAKDAGHAHICSAPSGRGLEASPLTVA